MNKTTFVVFLSLFATSALATELSDAISGLENAWSAAYYQGSEGQQKQMYPRLLKEAEELTQRYPEAAEPKIWQATIIAANAALESTLTVLSSLETAKSLLEQAIRQNPAALDGAAHVTLGTLYYRVPGWPISFGDTHKAEQLLKTSLSINPNGIDANYFYADFLLRQDRTGEAEDYLRKAAQAPIRKQQFFADSQLQNEAKQALTNTRQHRPYPGKSKFQSLFAAASDLSE